MSTMVPLYGFGGGSGGTGATLTVNAPAGCTVTVTKDGKSKTKVAGADGVVVFKGLATGTWTVTITDGEQTAQKTVTITADYSTEITFFSATIHVTYPAGSTCTATDGTTTLTAPNTSGTWDCVVPNAGTWTVSIDNSSESVEITQSGETVYVSLPYWIFKSGLGAVVPMSADGYGFSASGNIRTDSIELFSKEDGSRGVGTNKPIDLTDYKSVSIDYKTAGTDSIQGTIAVRRRKNGSDVAKIDFSKSSAIRTILLDVSTLTGNYYITLYTYNHDKIVYVYNIKLVL